MPLPIVTRSRPGGREKPLTPANWLSTICCARRSEGTGRWSGDGESGSSDEAGGEGRRHSERVLCKTAGQAAIQTEHSSFAGGCGAYWCRSAA
eukprot:380212-Prymnesium_polylepis.1